MGRGTVIDDRLVGFGWNLRLGPGSRGKEHRLLPLLSLAEIGTDARAETGAGVEAWN